MSRGRSFLIWLTMVFCLALEHGRACSCFPAPPPLKAMRQTDAIFTGKVISTKLGAVAMDEDAPRKALMVTVEVLVTKSIKGDVAKHVTVLTGSGGGDCGYSFERGKSYLFYASRNAAGKLTTDICTRTQPLEGARDEILELEGRLPPPSQPAQDPILDLKGSIDDQGYNGFVFVLWNRLHERIFYFEQGFLTQVNVEGRWEFYPSNHDIGPRKELPSDSVGKALAGQNESYGELDPKRDAFYIGRLTGMSVFVAKPTSIPTWRIGFQYVTEAELDAGARIQDSKHYIWSEPMNEKTVTKKVTFKEGLGAGWLAYPIGKP